MNLFPFFAGLETFQRRNGTIVCVTKANMKFCPAMKKTHDRNKRGIP